jgi:hypothetical protein
MWTVAAVSCWSTRHVSHGHLPICGKTRRRKRSSINRMMMGRRNRMITVVTTSVHGRTILIVASVPHPIVPVVVVVTMIIIRRMYGIIDIIFHPVSVPVLSRYIAVFGRAIVVVEEEVVVPIPIPPTHIPSKHQRFRNRRKRFVVLGNLPNH